MGKRKVSSRKRKKVEYRPTEGDPRNTQASFRLQDFKMWKFSTFSEFAFYALLLLASPPAVNSKETPTPRMCAVCLEKDCTTGVSEIYPADSDTAVWVKANSQTAIQNCSMENLKPDAPCKMASLVQLAKQTLRFEGIYPHGARRIFHSQSLPCADLNLPPSSTPSPVTKTPIHNTPNPTAPNISDSGSGIIIGIIIGSVIGGIVIGISIGIGIGFLIGKLCNCRRGQDRGRRQGNNGVPPHDTEHRDENTIQIQPLKGEVANGNINGVH